MAKQRTHGKKRCSYCRSDASVWLWYRTRCYPSGRVALINASACDQHETCPAFVGLQQAVADKSPYITRAARAQGNP